MNLLFKRVSSRLYFANHAELAAAAAIVQNCAPKERRAVLWFAWKIAQTVGTLALTPVTF